MGSRGLAPRRPSRRAPARPSTRWRVRPPARSARPPASSLSLSLAIRPRECFGLLGVNGAGKSTTFQMLTAHTRPSGGDAHIAGHSVIGAPDDARRQVGLCTQHDALIGRMTAHEHLALFAALRGLDGAAAAPALAALIRRVGLDRHAHRTVQTYSGGNKRKLCLAIALVGSPPLLCLDEPSSGMDAAAKRAMWAAIRTHVAQTGASAIVTSHSMEEAEALCGRIGIMVGGRLRCVGSVHRLKSRFGDGYTATVRLRDRTAVDAARALVASWASARGPLARCSVQEERGTTLILRMPPPAEGSPPALAALFAELERARRGAVGIDAYTVSQASLEKVFLRIAESNGDGDAGDARGS